MADVDALTERVRAVERALTDGDDLPSLDAADAERMESLADRLERVEDRLDDLEADVEGLRGYVGYLDGATDSSRARESGTSRATGARRESGTHGNADGSVRESGRSARADLPHPVPEFDPVRDDESESGTGSESLRERLEGLL